MLLCFRHIRNRTCERANERRSFTSIPCQQGTERLKATCFGIWFGAWGLAIVRTTLTPHVVWQKEGCMTKICRRVKSGRMSSRYCTKRTEALRFAALLLANAIQGCETQQPGATETVSASVQAIQSEFSVSLGFPSGFDQSNVALYSTQSLRIADAVQVKSADGVYAAAVNTGTSTLQVGAEGSTGTLLSGGPIVLNSRSTVNGNAQAGSTITVQDGVTITGRRLPNTPPQWRSQVSVCP